jgi:uncharacterized protein (TIGR03437 family)
MRRLAGVLLFALSASAQFQELTVTADGARLFFTTSFRLKSVPDQRYELRGYAVDTHDKTLNLVAERGVLARTDAFSSTDGVTSLRVSGDGESVAFSLSNICPSGPPCTRTQRAEIRGRFEQILGEGIVWMSRNGEWAVLNTPALVPLLPGEPTRAAEAFLIHLSTGERTAIPVPGTRGNPLASDGSVFVRSQNPNGPGFSIGVLKNGEMKPFGFVSGAFAAIALSDDGSAVVYERVAIGAPGQPPPPFQSQILVRNVATGEDRLLFSGNREERLILLGMSNTGERVLLQGLAGEAMLPRVAIAEAGRENPIPLPLLEGERATAGTLTADGNTAFLSTNFGRLLRFGVNSDDGAQTAVEVLPLTPSVCCGIQRFSPGEVVRLEVLRNDESDWTDRIVLDDQPLFLITTEPGGVIAQVPWATFPGSRMLRINVPSDSPFFGESQVFVSPTNPRLLPADRDSGSILGFKILRGDRSGPLTTQPASGDTVHIYMTGLGLVRGDVQTGIPAPLNDQRPITGSIQCRFIPHASDSETVFAGLAPGLLGIYEVTLRLPASSTTAPISGLQCVLQTGGSSASIHYRSQ